MQQSNPAPSATGRKGLEQPRRVRNLRRSRRVAAVAVVALLARSAIAADEPLTIERLVSEPAIDGVSPSAPAWSPDSRTLAFLWNDRALPQRHLWTVDKDGSDLRRLARDAESAAIQEFDWLPDGKTLVLLSDGDLWTTTADGRDRTRLTDTGGGKSQLSVSPDGRHAAYLQDGDLWLADLDSGRIERGTRVGVPGISPVPVGRYNRPDAEIGPGIWGGPTYAWSPDSRYIAVHFVDRRHMGKVPFPYYLGAETIANEVRRGYPGDPNESRTVGFLRVADHDLQMLELPDPTANQVVGFAWSPDGVLLLDRASDDAVDRWLDTVTPGKPALRRVWHSHRPSRIYTAFASAWHSDGKRVVFLSDIGDRYGLYLLAPGDVSPTLITDERYDVLGEPIVLPKARAIFYEANAPTPYESQVFRIAEGDDEPSRLTGMAGRNTAYPSPDGKALAFLHSDDTTPSELFVATTGNRDARRITTSPPDEFRQRTWARVRYATFPSRIDDHTLHARILEPANIDRTRKYPVVFGPVYSNTVRNRWDGRFGALQQLLVDHGYVVVQVDVRGSTGYGRTFREDFLADFAGRDLEDLHSAVEYLATLPYVDSQRIGIWGSSYGGTLTIYSLLTKPGLFRAGVAGAAAVEPRFFGTDDVAIVRRPDTHPEVFERIASRHAANLEDHLLIIHGMQDQVVPFKSTVALAEALMREGKDFDFAFAPAATHSWTSEPHYARYLLRKLLAHFDEHLKGDDSAD